MRRRPSARVLVLNAKKSLLLFRFVHKTGALAGLDYWATPGGEVNAGETFAEAAIRELMEEAGMSVSNVGASIYAREFFLRLPEGEDVIAEEQFFVISVTDETIHVDGRTPLEIEFIKNHRWWSVDELRTTTDVVWPNNLTVILTEAGWW